MSVGARDYIDQMLVKRYAKEQANNPEDANTLNISKERYWEIQKDIAQVQLTMLKVANFAKKGITGSEMNLAKNQA